MDSEPAIVSVDQRSAMGHTRPASNVMERVCHHCGHDIGPVVRVGRRDACLNCDADLHCCLNCSFYAPTAHNQCREPHAEPQVDKTVGNFCDYFAFRVGRPIKATGPADARTRLEALFRKKN